MTVRMRNLGNPNDNAVRALRGPLYFKPTLKTDVAASTYDYKQAYWDGTDLWRVQGMCKVHNRGGSVTKGTTDAFALEVKSEPTDVDAEHYTGSFTLDARGDFAAGGGARAMGAICRVKSGQTFSSTASIIGGYNNITNLGTINGTGTHAAIHADIGAGGTWTACARVSAAWLDSRLAATPTAGILSMLSMTNNGAATFTECFHIYGSLKMSKLFNIEQSTGGSGFCKASGTAHSATVIYDLYCTVDGVDGYLKMYAAA